MKLRIGIYDVCAALVVLAVILVPGQSSTVQGAYERISERDEDLGTAAQIREISELQSRLAVDPNDGAAADRLGRLLERLEQHDQSLRVGGDAAINPSPLQWRAYVAVSSAHAERLRYVLRTGDGVLEELELALSWANKAVDACVVSPTCSDSDRGWLGLYQRRLQRGVDAISKGLDPARNPEELQNVMNRSQPTATIRGN